MKRTIFMMFLCIGSFYGVFAQNIVKGIVVDSNSETPLQDVVIQLKKTNISKITTNDGVFIVRHLTNGSYIVEITLKGYEPQNFPIQFVGKTIDLGIIFLYENISEVEDLSVITLTDDELNDDSIAADNISGLLQSSKDIYLKTAAYEFSASFFRIRGLDSDNATLFINGIEMNKIHNGRPQWSNWGGLNDVLKNQEFTNGLTPSSYTFGGVLGTTNINVRASEARAGGRISYASSNRSYVHRVMASYASGLLKNNWAFTISASKRAGVEGFSDGTLYNANSLFLSIEKKINKKHALNFTGIYTPNRRGKSSANTQEVYDLRGIKYNSYWGVQNGVIRNSRIKEIVEPMLMLNHYWKISDKTTLNTNIAYQFGKVGNSRIDYRGSKIDGTTNGIPIVVSLGGANPDPTYYQKLPSYQIRNNNTGSAYELEQEFLKNGQLNWTHLYRANLNSFNEGNSTYVLYEDRNDDQQFWIHSIFEAELTNHVLLNASLQYRKLRSENFAKVLDLLGGTGFLDIDTFAEGIDRQQSDLLHPNRIVDVGDAFKYHFILNANVINGFVQTQFNYPKIDFYTAASFSKTSYQRNGLYQNGKFANTTESLGKSKRLRFINFGIKGGFTYKITGRHLLNFNASYLTKAPVLQNSFSNSRVQNASVEGLTNEKISTADASYIIRTPLVQAKITGYISTNTDATEVGFYYADGIGGSGNDFTTFVQEIITEIDTKHFGVEIGIEAQITSSIKLKGAANIGQYTYNNNPTLTLKSETEKFEFDTRPSNLKNYKLAAGPQHAYSVGFEYRDPQFWWIGATINFFENAYVDIAPLTRTSNFSDDGGIPFNDYDPVLAKQLLQQEKFDPYSVVNAVGGKSWKINNYYIGVFASISNLLNTHYKTGGFEQGRNANFRELRDDKSLKKPLFGTKYWYGRGTSYFLNLTIRF